MNTEIVQLARNYKEALKALAKAKKALVVAMEKDEREARSFRAKRPAPAKAKKAAPAKVKPKAKPKKAAPAKAKKAPPAIPKKAAPAKAKKTTTKGKPKRVSKVNWAPYRATLLRKMKKGQWITGFDARIFSGHEQGPGFTQNVLHHLLTKGGLKKRKVKNTTQWSIN